MATTPATSGVAVKRVDGPAAEILTREALAFAADLARAFEPRRRELLARRAARRGTAPRFLEETRSIREGDWNVAPYPQDLADRRVEITGPCDRKMIINALNSGARVFMADFEDSNSPTWENNVEGQLNLRDAVRGVIRFDSPEGKHYELAKTTATLMVRPRGWHLDEKHLLVDGQPISASLFDFGLCFFHNAKAQIAKGTGPYFYLPKMESHLEARLWNDVFVFAQERLGVARGTIRATVLIETIWAAFEMDEILWELRDHSAGLNCGRWDYIFSFIKTFAERPEYVLPDRAQVTMDKSFLKAYVDLLIRTCHRRGIHALGGMAAQIPIKEDPHANEAALEKVRQDKLREVRAGHDGTWIAHPGLVRIAKAVFDEHLKTPNQIAVLREDVKVGEADLLAVPKGTITENGLRTNLSVGVQYLEAWLRGAGCVPLYHLMEDAATAEISRTQVWQWIRHGARLENGDVVTRDLAKGALGEELAKIRKVVGDARYAAGTYDAAAKLFEEMMTAPHCPEFMTLRAYEMLA
ncbi:MAG: malate synthase A [Planctomycetes bacterium]|nr:malate synthase A [Planctomycetota bacterium]